MQPAKKSSGTKYKVVSLRVDGFHSLFHTSNFNIDKEEEEEEEEEGKKLCREIMQVIMPTYLPT